MESVVQASSPANCSSGWSGNTVLQRTSGISARVSSAFDGTLDSPHTARRIARISPTRRGYATTLLITADEAALTQRCAAQSESFLLFVPTAEAARLRATTSSNASSRDRSASSRPAKVCIFVDLRDFVQPAQQRLSRRREMNAVRATILRMLASFEVAVGAKPIDQLTGRDFRDLQHRRDRTLRRSGTASDGDDDAPLASRQTIALDGVIESLPELTRDHRQLQRDRALATVRRHWIQRVAARRTAITGTRLRCRAALQIKVADVNTMCRMCVYERCNSDALDDDRGRHAARSTHRHEAHA